MRLYPTLHPDYRQLYSNAIDAIKTAKIRLQASPEGWETPAVYHNKDRLSPRRNLGISIHCSYLYQRLMITDSARTIRTCCFLESPPGHGYVPFPSQRIFLRIGTQRACGQCAGLLRKEFCQSHANTVQPMRKTSSGNLVMY